MAGRIQKFLSFWIDAKHFHAFITNLTGGATTVDKTNHNQSKAVRLRSLLLPGAGSWLSARPSAWNRTTMDPDEIRISLLRRLGANVGMVGGHRLKCPFCLESCRRRSKEGSIDCSLEDMETHALCSCKTNAGFKAHRHNQLRDAVYFCARKANIKGKIEQHVTSATGSSREADVLLFGYGKKGADLVIDTTVAYHNAPSSKQSLDPARNPDGAAGTAAKRKNAAHKDAVEKVPNQEYVPLAFNDFGGVDRRGHRLLVKLARDVCKALHIRQITSVHLMRRLSVSIACANAQVLMHTARVPHYVEDCEYHAGPLAERGGLVSRRLISVH
jgi:hypothetical protein